MGDKLPTDSAVTGTTKEIKMISQPSVTIRRKLVSTKGCTKPEVKKIRKQLNDMVTMFKGNWTRAAKWRVQFLIGELDRAIQSVDQQSKTTNE